MQPVTLKNKNGKTVINLWDKSFPYYLVAEVINDEGKIEERTYILYRGKKKTLNLGRNDQTRE